LTECLVKAGKGEQREYTPEKGFWANRLGHKTIIHRLRR